jgi:hypothetical protein
MVPYDIGPAVEKACALALTNVNIHGKSTLEAQLLSGVFCVA